MATRSGAPRLALVALGGVGSLRAGRAETLFSSVAPGIIELLWGVATVGAVVTSFVTPVVGALLPDSVRDALHAVVLLLLCVRVSTRG